MIKINNTKLAKLLNFFRKNPKNKYAVIDIKNALGYEYYFIERNLNLFCDLDLLSKTKVDARDYFFLNETKKNLGDSDANDKQKNNI